MSIPKCFDGKVIFITGGSGFIGKVLIEKLLRSCPAIENIYVLLRGKKGKTIQHRTKTITDLPLFDKLRKIYPEAIKKVVPINGDVSQLQLGLSEEDRSLLIERVHIIYHAAASVRFDDPLKDAVITNVRGTREVVNLASEMKHLQVLVHISTTYCNTDRKVIEEKIYPPHADWRRTIKLCEDVDQHTLDVLTPKYIEPLPNTYTFAKSLAEHVINDMCKGKLPAIIFRPSVVISTFDEPVPGWIDNFNGPMGLLAAGGKGILRIVWGPQGSIQDYVPVDVISKMLIAATYQKINCGDTNEIQIYNGSKCELLPITIGEMMNMGDRLTWDVPFSKMLWYPRQQITNCWYEFYIKVLIYHMLPALFIDGLLKVLGKKPMLTTVQRKIYIANVVLQYFIENMWIFDHKNALALNKLIPESDQEAFGYAQYLTMTREDAYTYFRNGKVGAMRYLFKESGSKDEAIKTTWRMWIFDRLIYFTFLALGLWFVFVKMDVLHVVFNKICQAIEV